MTLAKISNLIYQFGPLILALASIIGVVGSFLRYRYKIRLRKRKLRLALKAEAEKSIDRISFWLVSLEEDSEGDKSAVYKKSLPYNIPGCNSIYKANLDNIGLLSKSEIVPLVAGYSLRKEAEGQLESFVNKLLNSNYNLSKGQKEGMAEVTTELLEEMKGELEEAKGEINEELDKKWYKWYNKLFFKLI